MLNHVFKEATDMSRAEPVLSTFYHSKIDDHQYRPFIYGVILTHLDSERCLLQLETCNPFCFASHTSYGITKLCSVTYFNVCYYVQSLLFSHPSCSAKKFLNFWKTSSVSTSVISIVNKGLFTLLVFILDGWKLVEAVMDPPLV